MPGGVPPAPLEFPSKQQLLFWEVGIALFNSYEFVLASYLAGLGRLIADLHDCCFLLYKGVPFILAGIGSKTFSCPCRVGLRLSGHIIVIH